MNSNNKTYKTIGEVAKILNLIDKKSGKLSTHTIRFWEKQFKQIKPHIFSGKRRYYDENSISILKKVQFLFFIIWRCIRFDFFNKTYRYSNIFSFIFMFSIKII